MRVGEPLSLAFLAAMLLSVVPDDTVFDESLFKVNHIITRVIIVFHQSQRLGWLKLRYFLFVRGWNAIVFLVSAELLLGLIDQLSIYIWWLCLRNCQGRERSLPMPQIRLLEAGISSRHWSCKIVNQLSLGRLLLIWFIGLYQEGCLLKIQFLRFFLCFLFLLLFLYFFLALFNLIRKL